MIISPIPSPDKCRLPELLAPAGSPEALSAALLAGADAVYLGGTRHNARMNARNFDRSALEEAVSEAHRVGGRVYLTLNTLLWDRELSDALDAAYEAALAGVDALIIADVGAAALIRRSLPHLPLHASTQLSGHSSGTGEVLAPFGFSRFVIARETRLCDLAEAVRHNPLEVEVFIHGALCVSHSGQCLFSSVVGGRSGNRGECAQPCRLPYGCAGGPSPEPGRDRRSNRKIPRTEESYPLSLKDLSLAAHVPALLDTGVASLKIEGRMKSAGYVAGVTSIWRRLLDERRAATAEELAELGELFSRNGFTAGYQVAEVDRRMMGVRTEADKECTAAAERRALAAIAKPASRLPMNLTYTAAPGKPARLSAQAPLYRQGSIDPATGETAPGTVTVTLQGDVPPMSNFTAEAVTETVEKQLGRTGGTPYVIRSVQADLTPDTAGLLPALPPSKLNALRRETVEALDAARKASLPTPAASFCPMSAADLTRELLAETPAVHMTDADSADHTLVRSAAFRSPEQITLLAAKTFDCLYLPLGAKHPAAVPPEKRGHTLPPVVFDHDLPAVRSALVEVLRAGVRHLLVANLGHLSWIKATIAEAAPADPPILHGDLRLNVANTLAAARLLSLGLQDVLLSPELTLPRMRDIGRSLREGGAPHAMGAVVYGRLPLMLLEKCAIREVYRHLPPATVCRTICAANTARMRDRMGKDFPILREELPDGSGHRNLICNSLPTSMSDRPEELARAGLARQHFLFTVETPAEVDRVITAYSDSRPLGGEVRRMLK